MKARLSVFFFPFHSAVHFHLCSFLALPFLLLYFFLSFSLFLSYFFCRFLSLFLFQWEYFLGVHVFNTASKKISISIKVTPPYASSPSRKVSSSSSPLFSDSTDPYLLSSSHVHQPQQQRPLSLSSSSSMTIDEAPSRTSSGRRDSRERTSEGVEGRRALSKSTSIGAFDAEKHFLVYLDSPLVYYDFPFLRLAKPVSFFEDFFLFQRFHRQLALSLLDRDIDIW